MCGFYGIVDSTLQVSRPFLDKQSRLLAHRGPDDFGFWISSDNRSGLAHRRLSIIDLSPAGHQPMVSDDGRFAIAYNGEVYNFQELRAELEKAGYCFRGHSDTEVILNAYRHWGEKCINRFNGMFAIAIYDDGKGSGSQSIFFARDRVGKKPLYYFHEPARFQFASELKAIEHDFAIDLPALNYYMALGYIPADLCLAAGIKKLPPAHAARLDLQSFDLKIWRYWHLPEYAADPDADCQDLTDHVERLFFDAVKKRMISDVPVGVLLSGGLDSSLVVAAAARQSSGPVKTFTVSIPGSSYDESAYAKRVAECFATEHHVLEARSSIEEMVADLAPFIDEPIADSSLIPSFLVSGLVREHVKVALGGDGGDELFGGYNDYPVSLRDEMRLGWIPEGFFGVAGGVAAMLPAGVKGRNRLASLRKGPLQQIVWGSPYFDIELRRRILDTSRVGPVNGDWDAPEQFLAALYKTGRNPLDCMTRTHFGSILPDDFMVKVDRTSMAHSLEMRSPFLDYRLVEFAFSSIPDNWKVYQGETRRIQRILATRILPADLDINRKQGFSIPLDDWLRKDKCRIVRDYMPCLPEVINRREVERLIEGEMRGRANGARLYALLMLGIAMKNMTKGWK